MAKVRKSDSAPEGTITLGIGEADFTLGDGEEYTTEDAGLIRNARSHPDLEVEDTPSGLNTPGIPEDADEEASEPADESESDPNNPFVTAESDRY